MLHPLPQSDLEDLREDLLSESGVRVAYNDTFALGIHVDIKCASPVAESTVVPPFVRGLGLDPEGEKFAG